MKAKGFVRTAALLVMVAMTVGLCVGCGGGGEQQPEVNEPGERAEYVYVADYKEIDGAFEYINSSAAALSEDTLYFASYKYSSVDPDGNVLTEEDEDYWNYYTSVPAIFSMSTDGSQVTELANYVALQVPEGSMGSSINALSLDAEGNIWVFENVYAYHYEPPEGITQEDDEYWNYYVDDGSIYALRKLDTTGAEISSLDLSQVFGSSDDFYINGVTTDNDGNIYISDGNTSVYVLDSEGNKLFTVEMSNWVDRVIRLADGRVAALGYEENGQTVKAIDVAAKTWGDSYEMPTNVYNLYPGGGDYLFYSGNETAFYGYNTATGENEKILNWLDSDIDGSNLNFIMPLEDGRILSMSSEWDSNYSEQTYNLITLVKTPSSELPQKTILTYACTYLDWNMRSLILEFNKTNDKYRIEVRDYSEYNTDEDYSAGLTKLTTEIVSGNVPDLLQTSELPIDRYAAKGLLEDLYIYMDADAEMSRDKFVPAVLTSLQTEDGKLYQMVSNFSVYSVMGDGEKVGYEPGWTLDELQAVMAQLPEDTDVFSIGTTQDSVLNFAISFGMDDYVNWETGECNFDSEDFISLLEFCNSFPAEFDWENYEWTEECAAFFNGEKSAQDTASLIQSRVNIYVNEQR